MSCLTPYYRQQLAEVFESIGLPFPSKRKPVTVKFINEEEPTSQDPKPPRQRSRSCTPSHKRQQQPAPSRLWRTPTVSRARAPSPEQAESSMISDVARFFTFPEGVFKFAHSWRPRKFVLSKLVAMIDSFLTSINSGSNHEKTFPERLWNYYQEKLGLRSLVEFTILDIVSNALAYREQSMEVDIFVRFLEQFYDPESDFDFFMYLRREILGPIIGAPNRGVATLSMGDCDVLAKKISSDTKNFLNFKTVMDTIKSESRGGEMHVDGVYFMYICLWVFHHQRSSSIGGLSGAPVSDSSQLIDSYIDSILTLKSQTKMLRHSTKSLVRDSVNMEEVIGRMLSDCCAERAGTCDGKTLSLADKLMTAVMNGDMALWSKFAPGEENQEYFSRAVEQRNKLLECLAAEKDERDIEEALYEFCVSIADTPGLLVNDSDRVKIRAA